jgi:gas vesicle protein
MTRKHNHTMTDALMFFGGGVVGAGMALWFAPQPGTKTRAEIAHFGKIVGDRSERAVHDFTDKMASIADTVGEKAVGILHSGQDLAREGKTGLLKAIRKGEEKLANQKQTLAHLFG